MSSFAIGRGGIKPFSVTGSDAFGGGGAGDGLCLPEISLSISRETREVWYKTGSVILQ